MTRRKKDEDSFRHHMTAASEICRVEGNHKLAESLIELMEMAIKCENGFMEIDVKDVKALYHSLPIFSNPYQAFVVSYVRNLVDHFIGP